MTVVGWHSCQHTGPVHEGENLRSTVEVESIEPLPVGVLAQLRSRVTADPDRPVLDWRFLAVLA